MLACESWRCGQDTYHLIKAVFASRFESCINLQPFFASAVFNAFFQHVPILFCKILQRWVLHSSKKGDCNVVVGIKLDHGLQRLLFLTLKLRFLVWKQSSKIISVKSQISYVDSGYFFHMKDTQDFSRYLNRLQIMLLMKKSGKMRILE